MSSPESSRALASPITSMKGSMALRSARGRGSPLAFCVVTGNPSYSLNWRYSELLASDTRHAVAVFKRQSKAKFGKDVARWVSSAFKPPAGRSRHLCPSSRIYSVKLTMPALAQSGSRPALRCLRTGLVTGLAAALITSTSAEAAGLIRDAETESLIRVYAKPIFAAAGLGSQGIDIHIVNDRSFNAFVVDGHNMFIHAGTLMEAT